jgi:ATP synthase protein I
VVDSSLSTVTKILGYQALIVLITTFCFVIVAGQHRAFSAFLGGGAAFIPNVYFAFRIINTKGQDAKKMVRTFYAGESGKLLLTAVLFILIFQIPSVEILPLLFGYISALSVFWFALLMR